MTESGQSVSFFNTYLAPYLYFAKKRDKYKLSDFGYYYDIKRPNGDVLSSADKSGTRAVLNNGTVLVGVTNGYLRNNQTQEISGYGEIICYFDINGPKKPNILGKDVFAFSLIWIEENPKFKMYAAYRADVDPITKEVSNFEYKDRNTLITSCKSDGSFCGALIQRNGWKIPKDYPLSI